MDAPLGILFLKKAELYNLIERLDKQADEDPRDSKNPNTWPVEKNIFEWSYKGHKHLGTPLTPGMLKNSKEKLRGFNLLDKNGEIEKKYKTILDKPEKIIENMVIKGFADCYNESIRSKKGIKDAVEEGIILNKEGLLLGEVIYNVNNRKHCVKWIYKIYSWLMDYGGAWVLLVLVIASSIVIFCFNFINISLNLINTFFNLINSFLK
jgi:hypothetical protein